MGRDRDRHGGRGPTGPVRRFVFVRTRRGLEYQHDDTPIELRNGTILRVAIPHDGRATAELGNGLPDRLHGMVRGLVSDPGVSGGLFAGTTDGELFASEDGGDSWELIADGLPPVWVIRVPNN